MKFNEKIKNFKLKKFFKRVDPISLALVLLLGASATFAGVQLTRNTVEIPVISPSNQPNQEEEDVAAALNDPEVIRLLEESVLTPIESQEFEVTTQFFNPDNDTAEIAQSIFYYQIGRGKYSHLSRGMSFRGAGDEAVNVVAVLSGTVSSIVDDDPVRGTIITIDHENGVQTVYVGVYDVAIEVGTVVARGEVIGTTGLSQLEPDAGKVVHFEIMLNGLNLNPNDVIERRLSELYTAENDDQIPR